MSNSDAERTEYITDTEAELGAESLRWVKGQLSRPKRETLKNLEISELETLNELLTLAESCSLKIASPELRKRILVMLKTITYDFRHAASTETGVAKKLGENARAEYVRKVFHDGAAKFGDSLLALAAEVEADHVLTGIDTQPEADKSGQSRETIVGKESEVPAEYREDGKPLGKLLKTSYLVNVADWNFSAAYISKCWGNKRLTKRVKVGKTCVYDFKELAALRLAKTKQDDREPPNTDPDKVRREAEAAMKARLQKDKKK